MNTSEIKKLEFGHISFSLKKMQAFSFSYREIFLKITITWPSVKKSYCQAPKLYGSNSLYYKALLLSWAVKLTGEFCSECNAGTPYIANILHVESTEIQNIWGSYQLSLWQDTFSVQWNIFVLKLRSLSSKVLRATQNRFTKTF